MANAGTGRHGGQEPPLVLVVEDESTLAQTMELYLRSEGYRTERALDGEQALALFRSAAPDLVLLDVGLPKLDGLEVLKAIRLTSNVPVVMVTARADEVDELLGLGLGADDYLVKPVSSRKLVARVRVALRRAEEPRTPVPPVLRVGPIEVDEYRFQLRAHGRPVPVTATEMKLLRHMALTPGRVISRSELYEAALPDGDALERAVDIHIVNLRRKLREAGAARVRAARWGETSVPRPYAATWSSWSRTWAPRAPRAGRRCSSVGARR